MTMLGAKSRWWPGRVSRVYRGGLHCTLQPGVVVAVGVPPLPIDAIFVETVEFLGKQKNGEIMEDVVIFNDGDWSLSIHEAAVFYLITIWIRLGVYPHFHTPTCYPPKQHGPWKSSMWRAQWLSNLQNTTGSLLGMICFQTYSVGIQSTVPSEFITIYMSKNIPSVGSSMARMLVRAPCMWINCGWKGPVVCFFWKGDRHLHRWTLGP